MPAGFVDDDCGKHGRDLHGVKFRGGVKDISRQAWAVRAESDVAFRPDNFTGLSMRIAEQIFRLSPDPSSVRKT